MHNLLKSNLKIFLVGGFIRDQLLGIPSTEKDWVVVGATEEQMLSIGFKKVGKDFPVFINPKNGEEFALARTENKVAKGYYGFKCDFSPNITLEQDLLRRDLTINAIAKDLNGNLIDPFGGQKDLKDKILRHVSPAFVEDPVRVLRVARFAAKFAKYGFRIAPETILLMRNIVANQELSFLTPERVWKEIARSLQTDNPEEFFLQLRIVNALEVIFPELNKLWGIPQNPTWHPEIDTGIHTILTIKQAVKITSDPKIRFAALCHDLGKGLTDPALWPKHNGHEELGVKLITNWCNKYKVPNEYKKLAVLVAKWHLHSHKALELKSSTILKLLTALDAFRQPLNLQNFLLACKADATGRKGKQEDPYFPEDFLNKIFNELKTITAKEFSSQNIKGKELGKAITARRIDLIKQIKQNLNS